MPTPKFLKIIATTAFIFISLYSVAQALTYQEIYQYQTQGQVLGAATPVLIGKASNHAYSASVQAAFPAPNQAGDLLIATVLSTNIGGSLSVTDSNNNIYTLGKSANISGVLVGIFYAKNSGSGSNTVTATAGGSANTSIYISEFSGLNTTAPLDVAGSNSGFAGNPGTSITTTIDGDLIYGFSFLANEEDNVGSGFTAINGSFPSYGGDEYQLQTTHGSASVGFSNGNSANGSWLVLSIAFQPSGSGGGTPPDTTPPVISAISSSAVSQSAATISWTTNENSDSQVSYGPTTAYGSSSALNSTLTTSHAVSLSGLSASTTYHYVVQSRDSSGNLGTSADNTFTTSSSAPIDTTPPTTPSNLSASAVSSSAINLSWTASSDNVGVAGYKIYRGGVQVGTSVSASYSDTGLSASTNYSYAVAAYDGAGNVSSQSSSATATTQAASSPGGSYSIGWTDLPNTKLTSVCPPNGFGPEVSNGKPYSFSAFCPYVINAWGDGIGDTNHNRMIIWGGGHTDYGGNEIYQLDLGTKTMTRLDDPSLPAFDNNAGNGAITSTTYPYQSNPSANNNWAMPDGRPNSRHTQGQEVYIPTINKMFTNNGGVAGGNGLHYGDTWLLDLNNVNNIGTSGWQQMDPTNGTKIFNGTSADGGGLVSWWAVNAYDPNSDSVISEINDELLSYNYHTNTYSVLKPFGTIHLPVAANRTIDTKRHLMITWGSEWPFGGEPNGNVYVKTISLVAPYTVTDITAQVMNSSSGCTPWIATPTMSNLATFDPWFFPGMAYDPVIDRTVLWPNTGNTVYLFNPDTNTCTSQTLSGMPPTASNMIEGNGTIGRFQYYPSLDAFALVSDPSQDAYVLKIDDSSIGTTPPVTDTTPPTTPTNFSASVISSSQVNLSWTASTDNVGVTGYKVYRGGVQIATTGSTSYSSTGLTASTNYSYTVAAYDAAGNVSAQSTSVTATTQAPADSQPPSVPTGLSASAVSSSAINLSWSASTDNVGVAGYIIYRGGVQIATSTVTSYSDSALLPGTLYAYTVAAYDAAGNVSAQSASASATTQTITTPTPTAGANLNGLGGSTYTCLDLDGDGYGVGPGCLGPDADDSDPSVHTGAQVISKYGSLSAFLAHLGYTPTNIWYLSPNGVDASTGGVPNCENNINAPCLTYTYINGKPQPGDMLMMRDQWSGRLNIPSGTAGHPFYVMSYPGEQANFVGNVNFFDTSDRSYLVIDGLKLSGGAYIAAGTVAGGVLSTTITFHDNIFRHIDAVGPFAGLGGLYGFTMANVTVEDSAFHDNDAVGSQHGIYMGSRYVESTNVVFQRLLIYHNDWNGIHWNGRCSGCTMQDVVAYSNGITGLDFEQGWNHSVIQDNLSFNNAKAFILYDYPGQCPAQGNYTAGTVWICPYDENYNLIQNNTFYNTGNDGGFNTLASGCPTGVDDCGQAAISIRNVTMPLMGNFDHNTFRNNIIANYGFNNHNPPIYYSQNNGSGETCDATCLNWLSTSTFQNNVFHQEDGHNGSAVLLVQAAPYYYTCAQASLVTTMTGCANADPKFVNASIGLFNNPTAFNFNLQSTSPAVAAGTTVGTPAYDIVGNAFNNPPSIGAYEYNSSGIVTPPSSDTTPPTTPANLSAVAISSTAINLSWTASTDNVGVIGYKVYRNGSFIGSSATNSYSDTGLAPAATYSYTVSAYDAAGNTSSQSSPASATTLALLPSISNLLGSNTTANSTQLSWNTNVLTNGQVFYGTSTSYGLQSALLNTSPLTTTHSVTLTGLSPSTLYHFKITSIDILSNSTSTADFIFTTLSASSSPPSSPPVTPSSPSGGGAGGGGAPSSPPSTPVTVYIPPAAPTPSPLNPTPSTPSSSALRLINASGTFYLVINGQLRGITNPGMLSTYGFTFTQAKTASAQDLALPKGTLLTPQDGSLVKSQADPTVYLISKQQRYAFTSASVFTSLGFKFSSVLLVTNPELQVLLKAPNLSSPTSQHLPGTDINKSGTIYWIGQDNQLHPYPSLSVYNSWHIANDFSRVVPANSADLALPVGSEDGMRVVQ